MQVLLGDCLDLMHLLDAASVDMVLTDVPYAVGFKHINTSYNDDTEYIKSLMPRWFSMWHRVLKDNSFLMMFTGVKNIENWITEGKQAGFIFKNLLATRIFHSASNRASNNFGFNMQPILVFSKGTGRKFNEVDAFPTSPEWLKDARNKTKNPFTYEYPSFIEPNVFVATEKFGSDSKGKEFHPNAKNVELCGFLIGIATDKGDVVLDPFCGSGTTGVAALGTGRDFIGMEIDEHWHEVAKRRLSGDISWRDVKREQKDEPPKPEQMELF